ASRVGADEVPQHHVAQHGRARVGDAFDEHAILGIARDDVALPGGRAADGVVDGPEVDVNAVALVGQGGTTAGVRADEVPQHDVAGGAGVGEAHAVLGVARNDIPFGGDETADGVVHRGGADVHAVALVRNGGGARGVQADGVAEHHVAGGAGQVNAVAGV